jgi:hypothetical protein
MKSALESFSSSSLAASYGIRSLDTVQILRSLSKHEEPIFLAGYLKRSSLEAKGSPMLEKP